MAVVIPALNEEASIGLVLAELPVARLHQIVVADNASTDDTAAVARAAGATVVSAPRRGYGSACLAGIAALDEPDVVVFLDGDRSDFPEELPALLAPILEGRADLVIGARGPAGRQRGSMLPQQLVGNWIATRMIRLLFEHRYTDLGPFRAITWAALQRIGMIDPDYGWTVEMQVRALQEGLAVTEVPVRYRRRIGQSKVAGTVAGTVGAGFKIVATILRLRMRGGRAQRPLSDQS